MNTIDQLVREVVLELADTRQRGESFFFDPIPLFTVLGSTLGGHEIQECLEQVIGDGYGDPVDLDPSDEEQTSRLERTILGFFHGLEIEELFTIDFIGWPNGLQQSMCLASVADLELALLYDSLSTPSFRAFAFGDDLLEWIKCEGDVALPRVSSEDAEPVQIRVFKKLPWTRSEVLSCVQNLTGCLLSEDHILGAEKLLSDEDEQTSHQDEDW